MKRFVEGEDRRQSLLSSRCRQCCAVPSMRDRPPETCRTNTAPLFGGRSAPQSLDDNVTEDNPVRVVEAFIDAVDLADLALLVCALHSLVVRPITPPRY